MSECVIGIHDGHDCSIALLVNGEIVAALQEERFTNRKNEWGFPYNAAKWLMNKYNPKDISCVVLGDGRVDPALCKVRRETNFSIDDWVREQQLFWKKRLLEKKNVDYYEIFSNNKNFKYDEYYDYNGITFKYNDPGERDKFAVKRREFAAKFFGVDTSKVIIPEHERSHQHYALYASPLRKEKINVITCEGRGSYSNATVSVYDGEKITEICAMEENYIPTIYRYVTLILGMKPNEHEYKVMGLAPYAKDKDVDRVLPIFNDLLKVDGIVVKWRNRPPDTYFTLKDRFEGKRFDHIAGALQKFTEDILKEWFVNIAKHTGIRKFVFSGGAAQNIKAVKAISEMPEIEDIFVCPAAGDTSLSIGAAYFGYLEMKKNKNGLKSEPKPIKTVYLGNEFTDSDCMKAIKDRGVDKKYKVINAASASDIARIIADGHILGRFSGRMEFGLRAMGNRSILADPRDYNIIKRLNEKIKNRDFWMPFTPTVLDKYADSYIQNPKRLKSPFMTMAFETTEEGRQALPAAIHPADFTARPQILKREDNPSYYELIECFAKLTGVGALLNTSFNLHGYPIAGTPEKAIETFENSELDGLILNSILVLRK